MTRLSSCQRLQVREMVEIQSGKRTVRSQLAAAGDRRHSPFVVLHLEILLGLLVTDAHSQCVSSVVGRFPACGTCQMKCQNKWKQQCQARLTRKGHFKCVVSQRPCSFLIV